MPTVDPSSDGLTVGSHPSITPAVSDSAEGVDAFLLEACTPFEGVDFVATLQCCLGNAGEKRISQQESSHRDYLDFRFAKASQ